MKKNLGMAQVSLFILILTIHIVNAQWVQTYEIKDGRIGSIVANNTGDLFISATSGLFLSTDSGTSWTPVNSGLPALSVYSYYGLEVNGINDMVAASQSAIYLSTNRGITWTLVDSLGKDKYINSLAINNAGDIFAGMYDDSIYHYTNNGTSWFKASSSVSMADVDLTSDFNYNITCIAINGAGDLFAGTMERGLYRSADNGTNWARVDHDLPLWTKEIRSIAISNTGDIFAGTHEEGVIRSTDNGETWTTINSGLDPEWGGYGFAMYNSNIFVKNSTGVFFSTNNGTTWTPFNSGLPTGINDLYGIKSLVVSGNDIFITTDSAVWRRPISETKSVIHENTRQRIVQKTMFNIRTSNRNSPYVTIEFSLQHSAQVHIDIYNLSGYKLKSIVNKYLISGSHSFSFDARDISGGCYTVRMQAGLNSNTKSIPIFR
jgi:photosystem II stability/assembly factor-like uncharacterized protein